MPQFFFVDTRMELPFKHINETTSTNAWLEKELRSKPIREGAFLLADYQSSGRGQAGNFWEGEPGKNLLGSIVLYPKFLQPGLQFYLSRVIALGCYQTLEAYVDHLSLKWPNDIYYKEKKLGGILIENSLMGNSFAHMIAGMGININQLNFKSDAPNPVSLAQITSETHNIERIAKELQRNIMKYYKLLKEGEFKLLEEMYFNRLFRKSGIWPFKKDGVLFHASIQNVEPAGQLVLKTDDAVCRYWFKEVEFVVD